MIVAANGVLIWAFTKHLWKLRFFHPWLVSIPDLNGTYEGTLYSTYCDPETGEPSAPLEAILKIKQTFTSISCVMRTGEMVSRSCTGEFVIDAEQQLKRLYYTYDSNPNQTLKGKSPVHRGTCVFDIHENGTIELKGQYWTDRQTCGDISLEKVG